MASKNSSTKRPRFEYRILDESGDRFDDCIIADTGFFSSDEEAIAHFSSELKNEGKDLIDDSLSDSATVFLVRSVASFDVRSTTSVTVKVTKR